MKQARHVSVLATALAFLVASTAFDVGAASSRGVLDAGPAAENQLDIPPIQQSMTTSGGEAVLTMAYNHAYPANRIDEDATIQYAEAQRLYTPRRFPFTSPAAMVKLGQHFVGHVDTGNAGSGSLALAILKRELTAGRPVIIDVTTRLGDRRSGAHFVLVIGLAAGPQATGATIVYNNPQSGETESANWLGSDGLWNTWENNGDPGGSGWWLTLTPGRPASRQ